MYYDDEQCGQCGSLERRCCSSCEGIPHEITCEIYLEELDAIRLENKGSREG